MIGQIVSHYKILEKLGEGGMGVVYKAEDLTLGRTVALKFLPPDSVAREEDRARLVHEARAAAALLHPNICPIHEIAEADGRIFIAMACIEGRSLRDRIADGPLPLDEALSNARQIGDALASAHAKGIIHRDIKPGNVMLLPDGRPMLMDFGLAKVSGATKLTRTGMTMGTVAYMSPEQVQGKEVDHRSDIWALGVVLYEMVSGRVPFQGEYEAAIVYGIMNEDPAPLSVEGSDVPAGLDGIVAKALEKDPARRYQGADEFVADLTLLAQDREALPAGRAMPAKGLRRLWRRWRPWQRVAAVAAIVVPVALASVLLLRFWPSAPDATKYSLAVMDFRDLATPDDPTVSTGITELLNIGLIQADIVRLVSSDLLHDLRRRLFGSPRGAIEESQTIEIARKAGATLFLTGTIRPSGAGKLVTWHLVDAKSGDDVKAGRVEGNELASLADQMIAEAIPLIARACGVAARTAPTSVESVTTESPRAYQHYTAGMLAEEEWRVDDAIEGFERAVAQDTNFALAYLELGRMHSGFAGYLDIPKAQGDIERAWMLRSRLGIKDQMRLEAQRCGLNGRTGDAITVLREIRKRWPDDRQALIDLEGELIWRWYFAEVLAVDEEGRRLYPDDIAIGGPGYQQALGMLGRSEEALRASQSYVKRYPSEPNSWDNLGVRYLALGRTDSAEAAFHKAVELDPDWYPENFSDCAYQRGDVKGAIAVLEKALEQRNLSANRRKYLICQSEFDLHQAALYVEEGRFHKARDVFREYTGKPDRHVCQLLLAMGRAKEVLDKAKQFEKEGTGSPFSALEFGGRALAELGDTAGAEAAAKRLLESEFEHGGRVRFQALRIRTEIALARHDQLTALELLRTIEKNGGMAPFGGFFDIDCRTTLARAYRMAGRLEDAAKVHKEMLRIYGGHALSHYELGTIYEEMKRPADAKREYTKFLEIWSEADRDLPQLVDAQKRLAAL